MNLDKIRLGERRKAISPIIATLLLILIAIAAGVVVYAYVIGFVGTNSTNNSSITSLLSVDAASISHTPTATIYVRNTGSTAAIVSSVFVLSSSGAILGSWVGTTAPGSASACSTSEITDSSLGSLDCSLSPGSVLAIGMTSTTISGTISAGTTYTLKVTTSDGASVTTTVKAN